MSRLRELHPRFTVDETCGLFGHSRQAYYKMFKREYDSSVEVDKVLNLVRRIRKRHPKMGVRKLKVLLKRDHDIDIGRDCLFDTMRDAGLLIRRRIRHKRTTFSGHGLRVHPNLVKDIVPTRPDEIWVTDITYLQEGYKSMYVFLVTDVYSRMVVGWQIADNMRTENAEQALKMALKGRNPQYRHLPVIHHSDRGTQYCSFSYIKFLNRHNMQISMTERGDPKDNAIAERVNGTIKNEYLYPLQKNLMCCLRMKAWKAMHYYNAERPHISLNMNTPEHVYRTGCETHRLWKNYYPYYDGLDILD